MKCKECKERIPDNVKYCPECGALINNIEYNNNSGTGDYIPQYYEKKYYTPYKKNETRKSFKFPFSSIKVTGIVIVIISIIVSGIFGMLQMTENIIPDSEIIYDDSDSYYDDYYNDPYYAAPANICDEYVNNIFDCDARQDIDFFFLLSAFDWDSFVSDALNSEASTSDESEITNIDYLLKSAVEGEFRKLNATHPDTFVPYYFYGEIIGQSAITVDTDNNSYMQLIQDKLEPLGLDVYDYVDSNIDTVYSYLVNIHCEDEYAENNTLLTCCEIVVAVTADGVKVVYDDFFMPSLVDSLI